MTVRKSFLTESWGKNICLAFWLDRKIPIQWFFKNLIIYWLKDKIEKKQFCVQWLTVIHTSVCFTLKQILENTFPTFKKKNTKPPFFPRFIHLDINRLLAEGGVGYFIFIIPQTTTYYYYSKSIALYNCCLWILYTFSFSISFFRKMELKGKVALVTGAATGIGRVFSEELLRQGCKVSICDLDSDAGELVVDELGKSYGKDRVLFCHCDVTDYVQYEGEFIVFCLK